MALALFDCYCWGRQATLHSYVSPSFSLTFCYLREPHQPRAWRRFSSLFSSVSVVLRCSPTALCQSPLVLLHTVPQFAANKQKQLSTALCLVSRLPAAAATATSRCRSRVRACVCATLCWCLLQLHFNKKKNTELRPHCALVQMKISLSRKSPQKSGKA